MKKKWPDLRSDEDAERFVAEADLTEFDFGAMKPAPYEFEKKSAVLNMRLPESLLSALKKKASDRGIPFTRYLRLLIEEDVSRR